MVLHSLELDVLAILQLNLHIFDRVYLQRGIPGRHVLESGDRRAVYVERQANAHHPSRRRESQPSVSPPPLVPSPRHRRRSLNLVSWKARARACVRALARAARATASFLSRQHSNDHPTVRRPKGSEESAEKRGARTDVPASPSAMQQRHDTSNHHRRLLLLFRRL